MLVRYEKKIKTKIRDLLLHNKRECKLLVVSKAWKGVDERRTFSKREEFYGKERMQTYRKLRKRKEWQATLIPFLCKNMYRTFYSFALTSRSLKDFPFLYEMTGGSLKIWRSRGWFWIKCHFVSKACFKFDTFFKFDKFLIFSHLRGARFRFRTRGHKWVKLVVGSLLCSQRFYSEFSGFPLSS